MQFINLLLFSQHCFLSHFTPQYPQLTMPFHSTTIFTLTHLLPLPLAHLPQPQIPFKLVILYNKSIVDAHPSFLLEEAILLVCDLNRTPIVIAKHGGSCVHFSGISTCGRTSPETVSHPQRQPLPTPCNLKQQPCIIHWCYLFRCWKFNDL